MIYHFRLICVKLNYFLEYKIAHVYREANSFADAMANLGVSSKVELTFINKHSLLMEASGALRLDKLAYPAIRRRKL